ncbi:MAG: cytochrome b [Ghiorsea sp.]|nr:cytochrome b [Ghiorsea sp.]
MQIRNTRQMYGWMSIGIHWLMALAIFGMFVLGLYMVELTYVDEWYRAAPSLHIGAGMLLLFLLLFRLVWRLRNPLPVLYGNPFEQLVGLFVHRLHYIFMFFLMISGYLMVTADGRAVQVFTWFEVPALFAAEKGREEIAGLIHFYLSWVFIAFVALHSAAALKHHFVDKDRTLLRMLGIKDNPQ